MQLYPSPRLSRLNFLFGLAKQVFSSATLLLRVCSGPSVAVVTD